ncbi:hypothetical protein OROMI_007041 [Orobanche minor]
MEEGFESGRGSTGPIFGDSTATVTCSGGDSGESHRFGRGFESADGVGFERKGHRSSQVTTVLGLLSSSVSGWFAMAGFVRAEK